MKTKSVIDLYWSLRKSNLLIYDTSIKETLGKLNNKEWIDAMYMLIGGGEL